ncbi:hypothetical protein ASPVEDRAFT_41974 [Aspergillus versicolor CBS 583.65]|uniref:Uncharacterized protein n=1 Tax=Aspergillus versicolor CBS 583.65 TaxID=1036611 RepID=A0A1L9PLW1_ASPVE|nr:uncharacterized protein ASPVEDRAFT_41974 [Aspergillus versicolor CBS 583.65]OJJ02483.1 hypothetical protein ASPVEDRAFT_41974 [Aspergillus versicolor CBS 583.65]
MKQAYALVGILASLCHPAHGLVFRDNIKQTVNGKSLSLLPATESADSVKLGTPVNSASSGWEFNTEGFADDVAIITSLASSGSLQCELGNKCKLNLGEQEGQPFIVSRIDEESPLFIFQHSVTRHYVSRAFDMSLELDYHFSDSAVFELEKIEDTHSEI